jgi:AcrR family transcriptional regulator
MSKKDEILHAAMKLFAAKGYEKSSMAEVAAMTGTTGSNIFYHYRTKEDILLAILQKVKNELLEKFHVEIGCRQFTDGLAMVEGLAAAYLSLSSIHGDWFMLLHHRFPYELAAVNPTCREHLEAIYASIIDLFEQAIRRGQADGSIAQTPAHKAAMIVFAMVDGVVRYNTYNLYEAGALFGELMDSCRKMLCANHCPE